MSDTRMENQQTNLADDILEGADAIAEYLCGSKIYRRRVYYWAERSRLPLFRMGAMLCARKSVLIEFIKTQESRAISLASSAQCGESN